MSRKNRKYEDEYEDEYEEEYEDEYEDDYDDYEDEPVRRKNPLKGFVIALVILVLLLGVIIALLYIQLQSAEKRVGELTETLSAAQTELNRVQAEAAMATPAPTPEPAQVPEATPEITPEPTATPEPTPAPTATPAPLLKDTVTDEMLAGAYRPKDENWFDSARTGYVTSEYMLAMHWGPSMAYLENGVLYHDNAVDMLATQENWTLVRTENGAYGWVVSSQLTETAPAGVATATPAAIVPEAPATATPAAADNPI